MTSYVKCRQKDYLPIPEWMSRRRIWRIFWPSLCSTDNVSRFGRGFDSHRPLHKSAKFTLIRLPLLTGQPTICAQKAGVLRPFCAQVLSKRRKPQDEKTQETRG